MSPEELDAWSYDPRWGIRLNVAAHKNTSTATLIHLASDCSRMVRNRVLCHPNTPPLVKLYLQSEQYGGMTLKEFLEASRLGRGDV